MLCVLSSSYNIWSLMFLLILYQHGKCVIMLQCTHTRDFPPLSLTDKYISLGKRAMHRGFTSQGWTSRAYLMRSHVIQKLFPYFLRKIFVSSQLVRIFLAVYLSIIKKHDDGQINPWHKHHCQNMNRIISCIVKYTNT